MEKDLFETPELLPKEVRTIVENFNMDEQSYETCETLIKELNKVGYTCEYGLDAMPYDLRKLKQISMRRNAEKVSVLRTDIINDIKDYMSSKHLEQIEFQNQFTIQVDSMKFSDYDNGIEELIVSYLTDDGFVICTDGEEINLDELSPYELAWALDELEEGKYSITELKEN